MMGSNPGGIELQIPLLVNHFRADKPLVYLIHGKSTLANCVFKDTDIALLRGAQKLPYSAVKLLLFAIKRKDSIFHVFNIGPIFLLSLRMAGVKNVVMSIRGTIYWRNRWQKLCFKLLWKMALSPKIKIISNSDYSAARFREQISSREVISTAYNPIDVNTFYHQRDNYPSAPGRIIYTGRLAKGKNLFLWLDCAKLIAEIYPDTQFHIYGDGAQKENLIKYADKLGLGDKVCFHGFLKEVQNAYLNGDLFIFLSDHESFGNVVVESILAGTPVICSDIPSLREILTNYRVCLVKLDDNTPHNVLQMVKQYTLLTEVVKQAQTEFISRFSAENHLKKLNDIYASFPS